MMAGSQAVGIAADPACPACTAFEDIMRTVLAAACQSYDHTIEGGNHNSVYLLEICQNYHSQERDQSLELQGAEEEDLEKKGERK
jgi:predicted DsbA family dithiol-disulfide isomerase